MSKHGRIIGGMLAGALLAGMLLFPVLTIEVRGRRTGGVIFREKTAPGNLFTFTYIHSIENIPIEGVFAVEADGALRVVETRFPSHGAGLPSQTTGRSADGKWLVMPGGQRLSEFSFFISPVNQPSLCIGNNILDLNRLIESGDILIVAVRRYPLILVCLGRLAGY